jgi:predicted secreted protein
MIRRLLLPVAALATLALAATPAAAKQVQLTIADDGRTIAVAPGDTLVVTLDANQTTPFHWVVTQRPKPSVVRISSAKYVQPSAPIPGKGGTQRYVLKAVGGGLTRFHAQYQEISTGHRQGTGSIFAVRIRVKAPVS